MTLRIERLGGSEKEPHTLEVQTQLPAASVLMWHVARLPGVRVVAKKSLALTDDFEAYFLFKDRLFLMQTPFVNVWVSLLDQPPNELLFSEVEAQVKTFSHWLHFLTPLIFIRYLFVPYNPSEKLLSKYAPALLKERNAL